MIGEAVTHYRRLGKLGGGGKGGVFMAVDTKPRRFVALKFLPLSGQDSGEIHA
jgi:hypothetical protein